MEPRVGIAELKARLSEHLRRVREGHPLVVVDRGQPVARITPIDAPATLPVRKAKRPFRLDALPKRPSLEVDSLGALLDERRERR